MVILLWIWERLSPRFIHLLTFFIILCMGPLIAVPRTGTTTFEVGFLPFFPDLSPIVFTLILLMLLFSKSIVAKTPYMCGIVVTSILSLASVVENLGLKIELISKIKKAIPLSEYGLEWLLPSFIVFGISCLFTKKQ